MIWTEDITEIAAKDLLRAEFKEGGRELVDGRDFSLAVDRDDPGSDVGQNGFHVAAPLVNLLIRMLQLKIGLADHFLALLQVHGHFVEGLDEAADLVVAMRLIVTSRSPSATLLVASASSFKGSVIPRAM